MKMSKVLRNTGKVLALFLCLAMFPVSQFASAATTLSSLDFIGNGVPEIESHSDFGPMAVEVCNGYASHDTVSKGAGVLYRGVYPDTSNRVFPGTGAAWQCSRCRIVLITQFEPLMTGYVGYYGSFNPGYIISSNITTMWTNEVYYTSGSKVPYFTLRYQ